MNRLSHTRIRSGPGSPGSPQGICSLVHSSPNELLSFPIPLHSRASMRKLSLCTGDRWLSTRKFTVLTTRKSLQTSTTGRHCWKRRLEPSIFPGIFLWFPLEVVHSANRVRLLGVRSSTVFLYFLDHTRMTLYFRFQGNMLRQTLCTFEPLRLDRKRRVLTTQLLP
ncbi:unnamed protein product, partial [Ectocarpus sp. 8 AP-2014]